MRAIILGGLLLTILPSVTAAGWFGWHRDEDDDDCDRVAAPCDVPQQAPPELMAPVPGMYAQPPATGERRGDSRGAGIGGIRFRLPEISLELPSVEFPGRYRIERGAEMRVDRAVAPYVQGQAATYGMMSAGGHVPTADQVRLYQLRQQPAGQEPCGAPAPQDCAPLYNPQVPPAESRMEEPYLRLGALQREINQLSALVRQLAALQVQQHGAPSGGIQQSTFERPQPAAPAPFPFDDVEESVRVVDGDPAAAEAGTRHPTEIARQAALYEEKCREVDELRAKIAEMQREYQSMLEMRQEEVIGQGEGRLRDQFDDAAPTPPAAAIQPDPAAGSLRNPGGDGAAVREEQRSSADTSRLERLFNSAATFGWKNHETGSGVVRLSP